MHPGAALIPVSEYGVTEKRDSSATGTMARLTLDTCLTGELIGLPDSRDHIKTVLDTFGWAPQIDTYDGNCLAVRSDRKMAV